MAGIEADHADGLSWYDILPEIMHIAIVLNDNELEKALADYRYLCTIMREEYGYNTPHIPLLSDIMQVIVEDRTLLDHIEYTCFSEPIAMLMAMLYPLHGLECRAIAGAGLTVSKIYDQLEHRTSELSVMCRRFICTINNIYELTIEDEGNGGENEKQIPEAEVEDVFSHMLYMSVFNQHFCELVKAITYEFLKKEYEDVDFVNEETKFMESGIADLTEKYSQLFLKIEKINYYALYEKCVADVTIGMVARLSSMAMQCVELVRTHSGEVAELVNRSALETLIVGSWLWKRNDKELFKRFRDYSDGRDFYFAERMKDIAEDHPELITLMDKSIEETEIRSGRDSKEIPRERGGRFEKNVSDMADEIWEKDNIWYILYKRLSEVVHGSWSSIAKYHLHECEHPLLRGMYQMKVSSNIYAVITPAFFGIMIAVELLAVIREEGDQSFGDDVDAEIYGLRGKLHEYYNVYLRKNIHPVSE
jgi:hypothetical protein